MKTITPGIAKIIAGALERAAAASPQPISAHHLIDQNRSLLNDYLGARLCGLALHWLHKNHDITIAVLAKAIKTNHNTVANRLKSAAQLKRVDPWKRVYAAIAKEPILPSVE